MPPEPAPSRILYRLLLAATAINVLGLPIAVFRAEPWHASVHAGLALLCGYWALRLRHRRYPSGATHSGEEVPGEADEPRELDDGSGTAMRDEWLRRRSKEPHDRDLP